MRRSIALTAVLLCMLAGVSLAWQDAAEPQTAKEVDLLWALKIPMRDGVRLNATVFKPHNQADPLPVVFTLTPYIGDTYQDRAMYFAEHGYVYVLVDVRGRGNSEGKFNPFVQESRDGHDVVEFLARQSWCNGKVAMWGGSYAGYDQWATLREEPPHLATIVPVASVGPGLDFPMFNNIWGSYDIMWLTYTSGVTPNEHLFGDSAFWQPKVMEIYKGLTPFRDLDKVAGNTSTVFSTWMEHPAVDSFWESMRPTIQQYRDMKIPVLTITGFFDGDQRGALHHYRLHDKYSPAAAQHYLIIGPWSHGGTRTPVTELGGLKFNEASKLDMNKLHKEWYDWTMKGGSRPEFLKNRVAYFVIGPDITKEAWKYADSLEAVSSRSRTLYLTSDGAAQDIFHSGSMADNAPPAQSPADHYVYDPRVVHTEDRNVAGGGGGYLDQSAAMDLHGEGVIYHSNPFAEETEIAGHMKLQLWMVADVPDTDFVARVYEIRPDGRSIYLSDDMMRASYRQSLSERKLLTPGEPAKIEFTTFQWLARRIAKGSRLRLIITASNTPSREKNYNTGGAVEDATMKDARTAHITVLHDAAHPSALILPIGN